jgi:DNA-binding GntR family transcriptional regulator
LDRALLADAATTRAERICTLLAERIVGGGIAPGQRLDEQALAEEFGVSRTPVREAIRQLGAMSLVEMRARRGAIVACPDATSLADGFEMLAELEALCAHWSAVRMNARDRAGLDGCHHAMAASVRTNDRAQYRERNLVFHGLIWAGADNVHLLELVSATSRRLAPFRGAQFDRPERLAFSHNEHGTVVASILRGDGTGAANAMRCHIRSSGASWSRVLGQLESAQTREQLPKN